MIFFRKKPKVWAFLLVIAILSSMISTQALSASAQNNFDLNSDNCDGYIVKLKKSNSLKLMEEWAENLETVSTINSIFLAQSADEVEAIPDSKIEYVEPNYKLTLFDNAVDDELYVMGAQWDLKNMNVTAAWEKGQYGESATVAVIDSGLFGVNPGEEHEDIDPSKTVKPYNFIDNTTTVCDENGHGTFVSGQIFANTNNGVGVAGIMPSVRIMPLKVFVDKEASTSDVIRAIYYSIENKASVINMSLGGNERSAALEEACKAAVDAGILVVAAAGNEGSSDPMYPAAFDCVVGVGAVTKDNLLYKNSQYGEGVFVVAPGCDVFGVKNSCNAYCYKSGTSMAAPAVSALGAMAKSIDSSISQNSFMTLLSQTSNDIGENGRDSIYGYGIVDFGKAADKLLGNENHNFGAWKTDGTSTHTRSCEDEACEAKETALHTWDEGVSDASGNTTYTCTVCGQTRISDSPISNEWKYELINKGTEIKLTKYMGVQTIVVVPSKLSVNGKDMPVTALGNETFMESDIFWLELPGSIIHIDDGYASAADGIKGVCAYCEDLAIIKLSANLDKIPDYMFYGAGADYRMQLTIPEGIKEIGVSAFSCCNTITELNLPKSVKKIDNSAFYQARRLETLNMPGVSDIEADAFTETLFEEKYENLWKANEFTGIVYAGNVAYLYFGPYVGNDRGDYDESIMPAKTGISLKDGTLGISEFLFSSHYVNVESCRTNLEAISVPISLEYIPDGEFDGFKKVDMYGFEKSYAEEYSAKYSNVHFNPIALPDEPQCDYDWYDNAEGNTYTIKTADELRGFADVVDIGQDTFANKTVEIANDIDLGGITPLGYSVKANAWTALSGFEGTLDGQGHKVSGVLVDAEGQNEVGFFSTLPSTSVVKNLTVEGCITGGDKVGGLVGISQGAVIDNCVFSGEVHGGIGGNDFGYIGGIAGQATGKIINCKTYGSVTTKLQVVSETLLNGATGGIVGYLTSRGEVSGCENNAYVTNNGTSTGGIAGQILLFSSARNCINNGAVDACVMVGGIVGRAVNGAPDNTVSSCVNNGNISASQTDCGGIVGVSSGGNMKINDCVNNGTVKSRINAAGILGHNSGVTVQRCYNTGKITALSSYAGGIIGKDSATGTIDCYNLGEVSANFWAGGIAAYMDNAHATEGKMNNCYNMGKIIANGTGSSAVADPLANVYLNADVFDNCYYLADEESDNYESTIAKSSGSFKSGEVAYLLGDAYGQLIGTEDHPVFRTEENQVFTTGKDYYNEGNEPHVHQFGEWQTIKEASCKETGMENRVCSCGEKESREIPAQGHDYKDRVCTRCGEKNPDGETVLNNPFVDVNDNDYFKESVLWAVHHEPPITKGVDSNHFAPSKICTRGEAVTFLWRAAGCPEPNIGSLEFNDVRAESFCYKAVLWAVEKGITYGVNKNSFCPDMVVSRAQMVAFLYRMEGCPNYNTNYAFDDVAESSCFYNAVMWAAENGITKGTEANKFSPNGGCKRAHTVTFIYRCMR